MLLLSKVLFVAERSQKDPKEYLPFLNELKKHAPPAYRRYKIDLHLRRYKDALKNLSEIHDEHREELLELIQAHRLYKEALQHFPGPSQVRAWRVRVIQVNLPVYCRPSQPTQCLLLFRLRRRCVGRTGTISWPRSTTRTRR